MTILNLHLTGWQHFSYMLLCIFKIFVLNTNVNVFIESTVKSIGAHGGVVVKALRYKPAGRGFDSRWYHWNFSVT